MAFFNYNIFFKGKKEMLVIFLNFRCFWEMLLVHSILIMLLFKTYFNGRAISNHGPPQLTLFSCSKFKSKEEPATLFLSHDRNVAFLWLFWKHFHGNCSNKHFAMVPRVYKFKRSTRLAKRNPQFRVKLARCNSFFSRTSRL